MTAAEMYGRRFRKVLDYVDAHLDRDLTLEHLSQVASSSKYHFHRQFSGLYGISVYKFVQLVRLRRASYQLAFRSWQRITDIALANGYESLEAFARAFKKTHGRTPSEFRANPAWSSWHDTYRPLIALRQKHMKPAQCPEDVKIVQFETTPVAALEHRGHPNLIGDTIRTFIAWRKQHGTPPSVSASFNIFHGSRTEHRPDQFHIDLCAAAPHPVAANDFGVVEKVIPGGRCAVLRHVGSDDTLEDSIRYLYATWLPTSGEEPRDFPLYLQRIRFFPEVPEHEAMLDIFLPLR